MNTILPTLAARHRLPHLAATAFFFLGLSAHPHVEANTQWIEALRLSVPPVASAATKQPDPKQNTAKQTAAVMNELELAGGGRIQVLTPRDAALYRAAFEAQARGDWQTADNALQQTKDKRLTGHVLADRFSRRAPTLDEAQLWLASYADLPEAESIYAQAKRLKGFASAHIVKPLSGLDWSSDSGPSGSPFGFRAPVSSQDDTQNKPTRAGLSIKAALRRGEPSIARELLATEIQRGNLTPQAINDISARIAASFYYNGQIERARSLAHSAAEGGSPLGLWIDGMAAWKQQDYAASLRSFASLAQAPKLSSWDHTAAAYWAYRGAKAVGDDVQAHHWLTTAAQEPHSFYGYLAARLSGHRRDALATLPELNAKNIDVLAGHREGWSALALVQTGRSDLAEAELRRLKLTGHRDLQRATLALAETAHIPSLSLQLGGVAINDNGQPYEAAQYPLPPWQPTDGFKIDRALIYALIKHESQFDPTAVSDSGACGLMQIMPSTAREIINDNGDNGTATAKARTCPHQLFDPATNMTMGQKYVRVLSGQPMIGNNLMLLLAAYNGGPGNLSRWLDGQDKADPLLFMESLPMRETRDYVQQVLLHYWMYRSRLAEPEDSAMKLAKGEWPRYVLNDNNDDIIAKTPTKRADRKARLELASLTARDLRGGK